MKKYIVTEEQIKRVIDKIVNEQPLDMPARPKIKGYLKTLTPSMLHFGGTVKELKQIYLNPSAKFKVLQTYGEVFLNGKYISTEEASKRSVIITPQTIIEIAEPGKILMSGMGQEEAEIYANEGKLYFGLGW